MVSHAVWKTWPSGLSYDKNLGLRPRFLSTESLGPCFSHGTGDHDQILQHIHIDMFSHFMLDMFNSLNPIRETGCSNAIHIIFETDSRFSSTRTSKIVRFAYCKPNKDWWHAYIIIQEMRLNISCKVAPILSQLQYVYSLSVITWYYKLCI